MVAHLIKKFHFFYSKKKRLYYSVQENNPFIPFPNSINPLKGPPLIQTTN